VLTVPLSVSWQFMATHADISRSLRQWITAHYGNDMIVGRVCCRGSCCPIIAILSEAPGTRRTAAITGVRMLSFIVMNYCLWTHGSYNIQRWWVTHKVSGMSSFKQNIICMYSTTISPHTSKTSTQSHTELVLVSMGVNWRVEGKGCQMPPPVFFLPKKYFFGCWVEER
jgi:hypothetical protein